MKTLIRFSIPIIFLLLIFQPTAGFSQKDSVAIWSGALIKSKSQDEGLAINDRIKKYLQKSNDQQFVAYATNFLRAAAKTKSPRYVFYDLFDFCFQQSLINGLDKTFNLAVLKMEDDPDFSNHDVKYQLYYFYTHFYYNLKEYFYAAKYLDIFLKDGISAFPESMQSSIELNALTTLALIDQHTYNIDTAIQRFTAILELSKVKENAAWEGITSGNLAYTLSLAKRFEEAIPLYKRDDELSIRSNELGSSLRAEISLGQLYLRFNKLDSAFNYIDSSRNLLANLLSANETPGDSYLEEQQEIMSFFGNYYNQTGDYEKSSVYFTKAFVLNDSIQKIENESHLKQVFQHFEVTKNLNEINELQNEIKDKKRSITFVIIVVVAIACILVLVSIFFLRLLSKNKLLKKQNETINRQRASLQKINGENYQLFSMISHDVRGPAASVHRLLQLAVKKEMDADSFEKFLPSLLENSTNLKTTIESLLTWSMAQFHGIETKSEPVEIKSLIDKMILLFQNQAKEKSILLQNNCANHLALIDINQFEIILRNTISNAIKFSYPNSVIQFNSQEVAAGIELSVTDCGMGMTAEQIDIVLNKSDSKTTKGTSGEKGIGLGLNLVKDFLFKNSGTLKIESKIDQGTTMVFTVPKAI